jgi:hypothetical protein
MPLKRLHLKERESEIRVSESNLAFPVVKRATKSPPPQHEGLYLLFMVKSSNHITCIMVFIVDHVH